MVEPTSPRRFKGVPIRYIRYFAGFVAVMVALIHLLHPRLGAIRLIQQIQVGVLADPRPLLFTVSAFAIVVGVILVRFRVRVSTIYVLGVLLVVTYLGGYVAWHTVLDHGAFWPHIHGHAHTDVGFLEGLLLHVNEATIGIVAKCYEIILLILLSFLLRYDPLSGRGAS